MAGLPSDWASNAQGPGSAGVFGIGGGNVASQLLAAGVNPYSGATLNPAVVNQVNAAALGQGPSAAQNQLQAGLASSMAQQQSTAAGGRYGEDVAARQRTAAEQGASLESGAANTAGQLRANEQNTAMGEAGQLATSQAGLSQQAQLAQQQMLTGLYNQQTQTNQGALGSIIGAGAGVGSSALAAGAKAAPTVMMMARGSLVTKPTLTYLGEKGPEVVLPLKKGSAPYKAGPLPTRPGPHPSRPAPRKLDVKASAKAALAHGGATRPGGGAMPLSPKVAKMVQAALAQHMMETQGGMGAK